MISLASLWATESSTFSCISHTGIWPGIYKEWYFFFFFLQTELVKQDTRVNLSSTFDQEWTQTRNKPEAEETMYVALTYLECFLDTHLLWTVSIIIPVLHPPNTWFLFYFKLYPCPFFPCRILILVMLFLYIIMSHIFWNMPKCLYYISY